MPDFLFLKIAFVQKSVCLCLFVCVGLPLRQLITSGVIQTSYNWLNKFYTFDMTVVIGIISRHGVSIDKHHRI